MIWADCLFAFSVFLFKKSRRCDNNHQTTVTHFGENKRLHLESSKQNCYIISSWVIIKAIVTSRNDIRLRRLCDGVCLQALWVWYVQASYKADLGVCEETKPSETHELERVQRVLIKGFCNLLWQCLLTGCEYTCRELLSTLFCGLIDWCCFYYFARDSPVALLQALFARFTLLRLRSCLKSQSQDKVSGRNLS